MAEETRQRIQPELSDAERRRRLALIYRLLFELDLQGNPGCEEHQARQEPAGEQG